ncbi:NUDIX hydrolase [Methylobacterium isbiliense]|uniref:NADH pyrophosphatase n=1 Tax=Methylobacterium isbiliense TaxID=315478 RepID=A0ABQ4SLR3_9HYPH|nr:NUDIX hydrolase [Methylobacterium isbiliense]MDN3624556.1 NUDIX hydrolase [Methylobacterium isbiliense]GJE03469.1 NADH pyrophosphatase [Methylobacterium isbiliense]
MTADASARRYPARPFLAASVAVVRDGRALVAARGGAALHGLWSLPGGLVETGETLAETALRELREEVGVEAEIVATLSPVEVIERDAEGRVLHHFVIQPHAARWLRHEPVTGDEALAVGWVTVEEVQALPTTPGLAGILVQALAAVAAAGEPA